MTSGLTASAIRRWGAGAGCATIGLTKTGASASASDSAALACEARASSRRTKCAHSALALALAACDGAATDSTESEAAAPGYTLEIRASGEAHAFLITAPDGRVVGARAAEGASALMDQDTLRKFSAAAPSDEQADPGREVVSLRLPGVSLSVSGGEGGGESGRVSINADGHSVEVNANEGGPGESDDVANIRISGVDEAEVRDFIAKADELSPAVQAEMLAALGLE